MIEIYTNLFVGNQNAYEENVKFLTGWSVVQACKFPYHREALGYPKVAAPKDDPEYLVARRGHRLILNMIDTPDPKYILKELVDEAIQFIHEQLAENRKVLVHCNQGMSRSPGLGLLYLVRHTDKLPKSSFAEAERAYREIYPPYDPARGMRGFMHLNWEAYSV